MKYTYRIQGPDEKNCLRGEYVARELRDKEFCRHHFQVPLTYELAGKTLSFEDAHLPTGWVMIEEIIRFLIVELEVKPKATNWEKILRDSEERFTEWTGREVG